MRASLPRRRLPQSLHQALGTGSSCVSALAAAALHAATAPMPVVAALAFLRAPTALLAGWLALWAATAAAVAAVATMDGFLG